MATRRVRTAITALLTTLTLTAAAPAARPAPAPGPGHSLTRQALLSAVSVHHVPGALARVQDAHGPWHGAAGTADPTTHRPPLPADHFRIGSISKTFVATVVLQLEAEGRLALSDTVEKWLPGVVRGHGHDGRKITLRQLLNHTGGLFDYTEDPEVGGVGPFLEHRWDTWRPEQLVALAMRHEPLFEPGTGWSYGTTGFVLAAMAVEKATGHPYGEELARRVLRPLGLRDTSLPGTRSTLPRPAGRSWTRLPEGPGEPVDITEFNPSLVWAAGEVVSTTTDVDRFYAALLGGRLLPAAQLAEMTTTVPAPAFGQDAGLGIFRAVLPCGAEVWGHTGLLPGQQSVAFATRDARHRLVSTFDTDWAAGTDAAGDVVLAEFCGTPPGTPASALRQRDRQ
ncbi:serine hydrolase domain-containing protein [Streptomyces albireticuli]|uniref:Peptidase n=1 Tax=Streptomyces albireticuli TaxID=1940 RepID=A0A2A2DBX5_9ACTN|nr:serine hydrolase domain-containing protein [Streptomyces albireticuli]MCD9140819.1 beta-lactamase family protein [Streptomyces albireticuli]MCD9161219.1 beta-lactamase family protein [Streptomyces albireticuli]MCD9190723.1 beta-lactamase family protein [Streptomyces albireticuli]PAU48981.1 peptidase [Streptomyces albireticuli]